MGWASQQWFREYGLLLQRRLHLDSRFAHHQVWRHVSVEPLQRSRAPVHFRLRGFQLPRNRKAGVTDPTQGGNAFASFLLGYADSGQIDTIRFIGQQFPYFGGFIQDDWRVTPKLVVNYGLRYDINLPP